MRDLEIKADELRDMIDEASLEASMKFTLADAIREGCSVTDQAIGTFSNGADACALQAAVVSLKARRMI